MAHPRQRVCLQDGLKAGSEPARSKGVCPPLAHVELFGRIHTGVRLRVAQSVRT